MRLHGQQIPLIGFLLVSKQWGYYPGRKSRTITFPLAFNVIFAVTHSTINSGTIIMNIELDSVTNTQFKTYDAVLNNQYDCPIYWIAIGF